MTAVDVTLELPIVIAVCGRSMLTEPKDDSFGVGTGVGRGVGSATLKEVKDVGHGVGRKVGAPVTRSVGEPVVAERIH